jgi:hypothetical protein
MLGVVGSRSILALNWPMETPQVLGVLVMRRTPNIQTTMGPWNGSTDIIPRKSTNSVRSQSDGCRDFTFAQHRTHMWHEMTNE